MIFNEVSISKKNESDSFLFENYSWLWKKFFEYIDLMDFLQAHWTRENCTIELLNRWREDVNASDFISFETECLWKKFRAIIISETYFHYGADSSISEKKAFRMDFKQFEMSLKNNRTHGQAVWNCIWKHVIPLYSRPWELILLRSSAGIGVWRRSSSTSWPISFAYQCTVRLPHSRTCAMHQVRSRILWVQLLPLPSLYVTVDERKVVNAEVWARRFVSMRTFCYRWTYVEILVGQVHRTLESQRLYMEVYIAGATENSLLDVSIVHQSCARAKEAYVPTIRIYMYIVIYSSEGSNTLGCRRRRVVTITGEQRRRSKHHHQRQTATAPELRLQ